MTQYPYYPYYSYYPYHRVIWSEGMLIGPHHFQQWDRYHETILDFRLRPLFPFGWGIIELKISGESLENGNFSFRLETFRGVFPSGTSINIPEADSAPASRTIEPKHFASASNPSRLDLYLAIPVESPNSANYRPPGGDKSLKETRYIPEFVRVFDETTGENEQEVAVAKKNLKILFAGESSDNSDNDNKDNYERFKIAELVRNEAGSIEFNKDYIPPCLIISASSRLKEILNSLINELMAKHEALLGYCQPRPSNPKRYEFGGVDLETLWLLNVFNTYIPLLSHFYGVQRIHPEEIFRSLLQLAGQLSVLSVDVKAMDLPGYDHENLSASYGKLEQTIRGLLNLITTPTPSRYRLIELEEATSKRGYTILGTRSQIDERLFSPDHRFYLAVRAMAIDSERQEALIEMIPKMTIIAPSDEVDSYIEFAYGVPVIPGLPLPKAPQIPELSECAYFSLKIQDEAWESVLRSQTLAIYIPQEFRHEFRQLEVKLIVIQE